jgi:hypothetical protein
MDAVPIQCGQRRSSLCRRWAQLVSFAACILLSAISAAAQEIKVSPASVNAYSQGATSVYLTFTGVSNKRPVDACWCGQLIPATPDIGFKCDPATVFGCLPVRYDQARRTSESSYTDIMSIPASVARRAYRDAASGGESTFFYVRRFVSTAGGPDEYVPVTIRLSGNGAAVSFSLTGVKLSWAVDKPVVLIKPGEKPPPIQAEITYTGAGRLRGRWEIVKPGEELPAARDLLTEATLPVEERGTQRRYTQLNRFNVYLPPTGKFILPGPQTWRVPSNIDGLYLVLLRVEAVDDAAREVSPGQDGAATGGVAGFPMPVLRYYVGSGSSPAPARKGAKLALLLPAENAATPDGRIDFSWTEVEGASLYRLEVSDTGQKPILSAVLPPGVGTYHAPSWLKEKSGDGGLRWRVVGLNPSGGEMAATEWRSFRIFK